MRREKWQPRSAQPQTPPSLPLLLCLCGDHLLIHPEKLRLRGDIQRVIWLLGAWRGEIDGLNGLGHRGHIHMIILCYCPSGIWGFLSSEGEATSPLLCWNLARHHFIISTADGGDEDDRWIHGWQQHVCPFVYMQMIMRSLSDACSNPPFNQIKMLIMFNCLGPEKLSETSVHSSADIRYFSHLLKR